MELNVRPGGHVDVPLWIGQSTSVTGRIVRSDGLAVAGARVRLQSERVAALWPMPADPQVGRATQTTTTDGEGRYGFSSASDGRYVIDAVHPNFAPSPRESIELDAGANTAVADIVLRSGGSIDGVVLKHGAPLARAFVQLSGFGPLRSKSTDRDGRFRFERLRPGRYLILAAASADPSDSFKSYSAVVESDAVARVDIDVASGVTIRGTVAAPPDDMLRLVLLSLPGGPRVEDVDLTDVRGGMDASGYSVGYAMVDENGAFELAHVDPGEYELQVVGFPQDAAQIEAYLASDRRPLYRGMILIEREDVSRTIVVTGGEAGSLR
jgi:protocatechuate 3,4-dioxygenase beta subunit